MKKKILDISLIIIGIIIIIIIILIFAKYTRNAKNEQEMNNIVEQIKMTNIEMPNNVVNIEENEMQKEIEIEGYKVLGIIRIPKIELEYPILNETNKISMKKSITKFWGPDLNSVGNLTLAGHNNKDGTMFGKIKKLQIGDIIEIEDLYKNTVQYEIFDIYIIEPNDVSCVESVDANSKELTLITCTNGNKNRLITKAREI